MCGIFGIISNKQIEKRKLSKLANRARQRGKDSSGLIYNSNKDYIIKRADFDIKNLLLKFRNQLNTSFVMGHSRLITNGLFDNQPIVRDGIVVIHNGIIVNEKEICEQLKFEKKYETDTEIINILAFDFLKNDGNITDLPTYILKNCKGTVSAALLIPNIGKLILFSNNGSLYIGKSNDSQIFSSEKYPLEELNCTNISQIGRQGIIIDVSVNNTISIEDINTRETNLIPTFKNISNEEKMLKYEQFEIKRCKKCILPETMPFIEFDDSGVCNYCSNYIPRNNPKPKEQLFQILEKYRKKSGPECIVPFSGGRDSCWGLHLIVKELNLRPITYTYDWGMVTDLGRRNISRMCSELGVENIIIADDIIKKRKNIELNLTAWLKSPNLGMISILTAGDKHFFRHVETVKKQTGIKLNLWGVNPLEVTHFKSGFLGVPPDFYEEKVYSNGIAKQMFYQSLRFKAMLKSPGYFNSSLWDTISGEYYRSFTNKKDYFHIFDYWKWDEKECDNTLKNYDWELAPDTSTTWRIGDGTAAFYNYIYYTVAGFSEHDTFRSNQIRENQLSRAEALSLVKKENKPRYQNIKWYLDTLGLNFKDTIKIINSIPKLYNCE